MTTEGGGWTVIQKRLDGTTNFYRTWSEYKTGFGDPSKNYWIGNDFIHLLTKNGYNELRVDLQRLNGQKGYAKYSSFEVGDETSKYKLSVSGYSGSIFYHDSLLYHNGMKFSTKDQDNDFTSSNCALFYQGAWWYTSCYKSHLNGLYPKSATKDEKHNIWENWVKEAIKEQQ
ncbi:ficolin-2-like [Saccostrea echinata]|uniref:ficolin-2-like n=1 Tax=Saccostrea echinata TaxID=191078 RepID=UPI002A7ECE57|nr:ficolin-2-like [Saccostrea echinata]